MIAKEDFISLVHEQYLPPYASELCGIMSLLVVIEVILSSHPFPTTEIEVGVGSDFISVINPLWNYETIFTLSQPLNQVVREIFMIK